MMIPDGRTRMPWALALASAGILVPLLLFAIGIIVVAEHRRLEMLASVLLVLGAVLESGALICAIMNWRERGSTIAASISVLFFVFLVIVFFYMASSEEAPVRPVRGPAKPRVPPAAAQPNRGEQRGQDPFTLRKGS